LVNHAKGE